METFLTISQLLVLVGLSIRYGYLKGYSAGKRATVAGNKNSERFD